MKFHHLGIATQNIEESINWVKNNFTVLNISEKVFDKNQNADLVIIQTEDMFFELVGGEIVKNFIEKNITYYHICYEVDNIFNSINEIDGIVVSPPKEAILFNNKKVCFIMTPIGLIELLEK